MGWLEKFLALFGVKKSIASPPSTEAFVEQNEEDRKAIATILPHDRPCAVIPTTAGSYFVSEESKDATPKSLAALQWLCGEIKHKTTETNEDNGNTRWEMKVSQIDPAKKDLVLQALRLTEALEKSKIVANIFSEEGVHYQIIAMILFEESAPILKIIPRILENNRILETPLTQNQVRYFQAQLCGVIYDEERGEFIGNDVSVARRISRRTSEDEHYYFKVPLDTEVLGVIEAHLNKSRERIKVALDQERNSLKNLRNKQQTEFNSILGELFGKMGINIQSEGEDNVVCKNFEILATVAQAKKIVETTKDLLGEEFDITCALGDNKGPQTAAFAQRDDSPVLYLLTVMQNNQLNMKYSTVLPALRQAKERFDRNPTQYKIGDRGKNS